MSIEKKNSVKEEVFELAKDLIEKRKLAGNRMGINDDNTNTNLISKHYSPMIIRKYNLLNMWPCWIGLIIDENLGDLDQIVNGAIRACEDAGMICNDIQQIRNITGILSESITKYYNSIKENCVEGVAITLYCDKLAVENFAGDFMNHTSVRIEYAGLLDMLPHI